MSLKRPVTLPQARRWPAAAARRESFCARMGGMREQLTSERVARDPRSKINQALAAWDCDEPELLQAAHVSRGVRPMKITRKMVGAEAIKNPSDRDRVMLDITQREAELIHKALIELANLEDREAKADPQIDKFFPDAAKDRASLRKLASTIYKEQMRQSGKISNNPARKPARSKAQNLAIALEQQRAGHPRKAKEFFRAAARAKNPLVETVHWSVHKPVNPPHLAIAFFSKKQDAIDAAREAAQRTGKPLAVSKHSTYHFVPEGSK